MQSKIDVIVPVYNAGKYLAQCLDSLVTQSLQEIQIICVNDGSTDVSAEIIQRYARMDSRICVIEQQNKGYGAAVNHGLSVTQAEYIGIVEPDDFVDPVCFDTLFRLSTACGGVDITKCAYNEYYDAPNGTHNIRPSASSTVETHLSPFRIAQYPELLIYHPSIWSAIYKRTFLEENGLRFIEAPGAAWIDNPFFISSLCLAQKIVWSNERHYYYRKTNPESSSNLKDCSIPLLRALDILNVVETISITEPVILQAIYKRCINYIQVVTEHPAYLPSKDDILIRQVVSRIPFRDVSSDFFTVQEQAIHRIFNNAISDK